MKKKLTRILQIKETHVNQYTAKMLLVICYS